MSNNSSNNKRIAKNTLFLYIRMIVVMLVSLYTTRVVLRVLGNEDYGIYNVVCGFVFMFGILNTSLTTGTNRFYNFALGQKDYEGVTKVFNSSIRIQLIVIGALLFLVETIGLWYLNAKMVIPPERLRVANVIFQFSVISLILLILQIPYSAAVMAHEKMGYYAFVSILDVFLKLGFVIALQYIDGDKLLIYSFLILVTSVVNFALYFIYCKKKFVYIHFQRGYDKALFKDLFSFSAWSLLDPITRTTQGQGSNLVLNAFFGPIVNAAYGVAHQVSVAVDNFTQNIAIAFRPQVIQAFSSKEFTRVKNLMFSMSKVNYILHAMLAIPLILEIKFILSIWLGDNYPDFTVPFTSLILIARTIDCLHAPISLVMVASGKIKRIKIASAIVLCSIIPLSIVFFEFDFSPVAIFMLMIILAVLNMVVSTIIMCKEIDFMHVKEYLRNVILPCSIFTILTLTIPVVVYLLMEPSFLRFIVITVSTAGAALAMAYFVALNKNERTLAVNMASTVIRRMFHR